MIYEALERIYQSCKNEVKLNNDKLSISIYYSNLKYINSDRIKGVFNSYENLYPYLKRSLEFDLYFLPYDYYKNTLHFILKEESQIPHIILENKKIVDELVKLGFNLSMGYVNFGLFDNFFWFSLTRRNTLFLVDKKNTKLFIITNINEDVILRWLLDDILMWYGKDIFPIHSSAIFSKHKCFIFAGPPHVGKTTLLLKGMKKGYTPLSDDILWIDSKMKIRWCLPYIHIKNSDERIILDSKYKAINFRNDLPIIMFILQKNIFEKIVRIDKDKALILLEKYGGIYRYLSEYSIWVTYLINNMKNPCKSLWEKKDKIHAMITKFVNNKIDEVYTGGSHDAENFL